jgi:D-amino-acid oxidase
MPAVRVVGAGVVGLTAAIRLREAGIAADVVAREPPERTTSAVAAALWYPYRAFPRERVEGWSARGFEVLSALAGEPGSGVRMRRGLERAGADVSDPWWRAAVPTFERTADGFRFVAPVADMSVHLPWLVRRLEGLGGTVEVGAVASLDAALDGARGRVLVNCAGLGARELARDDALFAVRGQIMRVDAPAVDEWFLDQSDPDDLLYVVPREHDVVLGGTAQEGDEELRPDPATAAAIRARCEAAVPALRGAPVVGEAVGLRPARPAVRLEAEARAGGTVVHCYGHGGAGVTLAWGCADEVVRLVAAALG